MSGSFPCRNFDYSAVHVAGAARIARIAQESGVSRLVHVSHLNASPDSTSAFYRTKAEGEEAVKEAFPTATIIKPAALYGYEDKFLNNIACKNNIPLPSIVLGLVDVNQLSGV